MKQYFVYIMAGKRNGTLYIGVTNDLMRRVLDHKNGEVDGFTKRYGISMLVYYEQTESVHGAIMREKQLKKWERKWKLVLIEERNPDWKDLFEELWPSLRT
jgi:putative endonuclease